MYQLDPLAVSKMNIASKLEKGSQRASALNLNSILRPPDGSSCGCKKTSHRNLRETNVSS